MTDLIACLSSGKGTWQYLKELIEKEDWENIFLVTDSFGKDNFKPNKEINYILADNRKSIKAYTFEIKKQLEGKIKGFEVALNLTSGIGKEHMAILSAVLKLGLAIRLVALTKDGKVIELK